MKPACCLNLAHTTLAAPAALHSLLGAAGTVQQLQAEVSRLQGVLLTISGADNSAAAVVAAPTDSNGSLLKMMLRWREQRKMVLQEEIARLNGRIAAKSAGGAEVGDAAVAQQAPGGLQETLITWLELQGAAVSCVCTALQQLFLSLPCGCASAIPVLPIIRTFKVRHFLSC